MDDVLIIRYPNGRFSLNIKTFFPTTQKDIKTLFAKVVSISIFDGDFTPVGTRILDRLEEYLEEFDEAQLKDLANRHASLESDLSEQEEMIAKQIETIDSLKRTHKSLPKKDKAQFSEKNIWPAKNKLEEMKETAAWYRRRMKEAEKDFHALEKKIQKLRENIGLVERLAMEYER